MSELQRVLKRLERIGRLGAQRLREEQEHRLIIHVDPRQAMTMPAKPMPTTKGGKPKPAKVKT